MKYNIGDELYYVCPFVFTIEIVFIEFYDGNGCYIENTGAYLKEEYLFKNLEEAQRMAFKKLQEFYYKKLREIQRASPKRMED